MTNITIKVLPKGFSFSGGSGGRIRKDASTIYRWIERKLGCRGTTLPSTLTTKTSVKVIYADGGLNEADTNNPKELLYATLCFLEDFVPKDFFKKKHDKYI
mgnify:CR=1 FL=1